MNGNVREEDEVTEIYISQAHAIRALGYLGVALVESGDLQPDFEQPKLLDIWGRALEVTMSVVDDPPSPVPAEALR